MNEWFSLAKARQDKWTKVLYHLHQNPELSFEEVETTKLIQEKVQELGAEILPLGMKTGVLCLLRGAKPGPLVALRADIDAIAETDCGMGPVRSQKAGVMHACGHDLHTCTVLMALELLALKKDELCGDVAFIFQPAEEVTQGAKSMVENGLWKALPQKPTGIFSLHAASFAAGEVGARSGAVAASKTHFRIEVKGQGGQGGFPHECVDPIVAGAALIEAIQTIVSRNADPRKALVCAVYNVHAGEHEFFVTDTLRLSGSVRALDKDTAEMAMVRVQELCDNLSKAYACTAKLEWIPHVPVLHNDKKLTEVARKAAAMVLGENHVLSPPAMLGSDDFSIFGETVPIFYFQLGAMQENGPFHPLHSNAFCTNPDAISVGGAVLAQAVSLQLAQG